MRNPIWRALALSATPIVTLLMFYLLYEFLTWLKFSPGDKAVAIFIIFIMTFLSWAIFDTNYDSYDRATYSHYKKQKQKKADNEKELAELKRKYAELEQRVNEKLDRWDDF